LTRQKLLKLLLFLFLVALSLEPIYGNEALEKTPVFHLSNLLQDWSLVGLNFESSPVRAASELEVQEFIQYRNKSLSNKQALALRTTCTGPGAEKNAFCPLVLNPKFGKRNEIDPTIRREKKKKAKALVRSVVRGDLKEVFRMSHAMTESDLSQALRSVRLHVVEETVGKILKQGPCSANSLLVALGLRLENEFPAPKFRTLATALYQKAYSCGSDQSSVAAGYRLGLFQIWGNRCDQAEEVLSKIPDSPLASFPIDYRMRVDYWRAFCADQRKDTSLRDRLKAKLVQDYPLSLHALLLTHGLESREAQLANTQDPEILLRSNKPDQASFMQIARNVEVLLLKGEKETASILLKAAVSRVLKTEIPFQFYWSVLLKRSGDLASSFSLVAHIFRKNPELIFKSTLQLLYPLEQFDPIQKSNPDGDPFLILSLVRQESAFDVHAKSSAGAQGLMQLQWPTARQLERVSSQQLWDPETNLRVGVKYLRKLEKRFQGRMDQALAAYNAGPERVKVWSKRYPTPDPLLFLDLLPLQETRDYVSAIARNYYWYKRLYPNKVIDADKRGDHEQGERLLRLLGLHGWAKD
jgi:soluble lytic murein transglycosylase